MCVCVCVCVCECVGHFQHHFFLFYICSLFTLNFFFLYLILPFCPFVSFTSSLSLFSCNNLTLFSSLYTLTLWCLNKEALICLLGCRTKERNYVWNILINKICSVFSCCLKVIFQYQLLSDFFLCKCFCSFSSHYMFESDLLKIQKSFSLHCFFLMEDNLSECIELLPFI